jgi:hypothetical protein
MMKVENIMQLLSSFKENPPKNIKKKVEDSTLEFYEKEKHRMLSSGSIESAESLLNGELILKKFNSVKVDEPDWGIDPFSDRNWLWRYHQLEFIPDLLEAYNQSLDPKFLEESCRWINSWIDANYLNTPQSIMAWHDHVTALRLEHLILFKQTAGEWLTDDIIPHLELVLANHCRILTDPDFYMEHTNHGFDQMLILLISANLLVGFEEAKEWCKLASERLVNEIQFAFSDGGIHVENSPAYHQSMMVGVIRARDTLKSLSIEVDLNFDKMLSKGVEFLSWITQPNGKIPTIGDSVSVPTLINLGDLVDCPSSKYLRYVCSEGELGSPPPNDYFFFLDDGWAVFRSQFTKPTDFGTSIQLIMKSSFFSNWHRHDDDTSVTLHAFGRRWFIDTGMYNYHEKEKKRVFVRSALGHNMMILDGVKVTRNSGEGRKNTHMWQSDEDGKKVYASTDIFEGYRLQRSVEKVSEMVYRITDSYSLLEEGKQLDGVWVQFHLPLDIQASVKGDFVELSDPDGNIIQLIMNSPKSRISFHSGTYKGAIHSWNSTQYGVGEDSQVIRFHLPNNQLESIIDVNLIRSENDE